MALELIFWVLMIFVVAALGLRLYRRLKAEEELLQGGLEASFERHHHAIQSSIDTDRAA